MHLEDEVVRLYHFTSMTDSLPAESTEVFYVCVEYERVH